MNPAVTTPSTRAGAAAGARPPARAGSRPPSASTGDVHRFKRTLRDARTGLLEAQYQVGLMLAAGAGTGKNLDEALTWLTRAAERGHAGAQFMLGAHYAPEPGTAPRGQLDETRAMGWLYAAAQQGHARAHHRLAQLLRHASTALSAHHEAAAASAGLAEAQLALAHQQLDSGTESDLRSSGRAWLKRAADQGLPAAQTAWALHLLNDVDGAFNPEEGLSWLLAAAQQGWPPAALALHQRGVEPPALPNPPADPVEASARHALGQLFVIGAAGLSPNPLQARHWFGLAARQNHAPAHTALGRLSEEQDPALAVAHYEKAASGGDAEARLALAKLLNAPGASPEQRLQGLANLAQAAAAGHSPAQLDLHDLLCSTATEATAHIAQAALTQAAKTGNAAAQFRLATSLIKNGSPTARREAMAWMEAAAAQEHPGACVAFGQWLRHGPPDQRDAARGWQLLQSAALAGDCTAHWHMALAYATGTADVPKDIQAALEHGGLSADAGFVPAMATMGVLCATLNRHEDAVYWWRQAAQAGDLEAQFNLAQALRAGRGADVDECQALRWMREAAEAGLPQAQAELGVRYATGQGVPVDPIEAHKWFFIARLAGNAGAAKNTELSQQRLPPEQAQEGERRARSWRALQRRHD